MYVLVVEHGPLRPFLLDLDPADVEQRKLFSLILFQLLTFYANLGPNIFAYIKCFVVLGDTIDKSRLAKRYDELGMVLHACDWGG